MMNEPLDRSLRGPYREIVLRSMIKISNGASVTLVALMALGLSVSCDDDGSSGAGPELCEGGTCATAGGLVAGSGLNSEPEPLPCVDSTGEGRVEGQACGCGGQLSCEAGTFLCRGGTPLNACGGCQDLSAPLGSPCGTCEGGSWTCDGLDALSCDGEELGVNVCGGCLPIEVPVGASCGRCGVWACEGLELASCDEPPVNGCGGCQELEGVPGEPCGACGTWVCDGEEGVSCDDPGETLCQVKRFIVMGDTGEANDAQYRVSAAAQAHCDRAGGCDGFLMLGDNIYDTGAESAMDEQLTTKIDLPYANLRKGPPPAEGEEDERERMPIYVSLGNHDLGGAGLNSLQVQSYLGYAQAHEWFYYPAEYWHLQLGPVHIVSLHTNPLAYGFPADQFEPQAQLVQDALASTTAPWVVAFGHHPYRSNGRHGNAGAYEGIPIDIDAFGGGFRRWVDAELCNRVDFYLSGHDHNRQWLNSVPLTPNLPEGMGTTPCDTHFAVSGAGAKTTDLEGRGNDTAFEDDTREGFLFMEFRHDQVLVEFVDDSGQVDFTKTIQRRAP